MLLIALTSIPPRYPQLPQVLSALLDQRVNFARVIVTIPKNPARFNPAPLPDLPMGVTVIETSQDLGPAGKFLGPAGAHPGADLLICDDDWLYGPDWAPCLMSAAQRAPGDVIAGSTWPTERIARRGGTVLQGFAGAFIPGAYAAALAPPPPAAWSVDDIWLSGALTAAGAKIRTCKAARARMTPLPSPGALQTDPARDAANRAAALAVHTSFGIWPSA